MTIRTEINSQGQVACASSVALRPKMSHIAAAAAAAIMLVTTVTFVSGQSAPTNEFPNTIVLPGARSAEGIAIGGWKSQQFLYIFKHSSDETEDPLRRLPRSGSASPMQ